MLSVGIAIHEVNGRDLLVRGPSVMTLIRTRVAEGRSGKSPIPIAAKSCDDSR